MIFMTIIMILVHSPLHQGNCLSAHWARSMWGSSWLHSLSVGQPYLKQINTKSPPIFSLSFGVGTQYVELLHWKWTVSTHLLVWPVWQIGLLPTPCVYRQLSRHKHHYSFQLSQISNLWISYQRMIWSTQQKQQPSLRRKMEIKTSLSCFSYSQWVLPLTATKIWRINININTASEQQYHAPAPDELHPGKWVPSIGSYFCYMTCDTWHVTFFSWPKKLMKANRQK